MVYLTSRVLHSMTKLYTKSSNIKLLVSFPDRSPKLTIPERGMNGALVDDSSLTNVRSTREGNIEETNTLLFLPVSFDFQYIFVTLR